MIEPTEEAIQEASELAIEYAGANTKGIQWMNI